MVYLSAEFDFVRPNKPRNIFRREAMFVLTNGARKEITMETRTYRCTMVRTGKDTSRRLGTRRVRDSSYCFAGRACRQSNAGELLSRWLVGFAKTLSRVLGRRDGGGDLFCVQLHMTRARARKIQLKNERSEKRDATCTRNGFGVVRRCRVRSRDCGACIYTRAADGRRRRRIRRGRSAWTTTGASDDNLLTPFYKTALAMNLARARKTYKKFKSSAIEEKGAPLVCARVYTWKK